MPTLEDLDKPPAMREARLQGCIALVIVLVIALGIGGICVNALSR